MPRWCSRRLFALSVVFAWLGFTATPASAYTCPGDIVVWAWDVQSSVGHGCAADGPLVVYGPDAIAYIDCRTGKSAPQPPYSCNAFYAGEFDFPSPPPGCGSSVPPAFVVNRCEGKGVLPPPGTPRADKCADPYLADPVNLTTGTLEQNVTDLDLGNGLRFTRHYASNQHPSALPLSDIPATGRKWIHNLGWKLERPLQPAVLVYGDAFFVKRPLRDPIVFFKSIYFSEFITSSIDSGRLESETGVGVVFTDGDGTRVRFNTTDQLTQIAVPNEAAIDVSYGADTQTFTQGGKSLTLGFYPAAHVNAGRVASVSGGGESWT